MVSIQSILIVFARGSGVFKNLEYRNICLSNACQACFWMSWVRGLPLCLLAIYSTRSRSAPRRISVLYSYLRTVSTFWKRALASLFLDRGVWVMVTHCTVRVYICMPLSYPPAVAYIEAMVVLVFLVFVRNRDFSFRGQALLPFSGRWFNFSVKFLCESLSSVLQSPPQFFHENRLSALLP